VQTLRHSTPWDMAVFDPRDVYPRLYNRYKFVRSSQTARA